MHFKSKRKLNQHFAVVLIFVSKVDRYLKVTYLPSNIVQFVCGNSQSLFLDSEGNVFSDGDNYNGSLGLGHKTKQNELNKIPNIPPIKVISCVFSKAINMLTFKRPNKKCACLSLPNFNRKRIYLVIAFLLDINILTFLPVTPN